MEYYAGSDVSLKESSACVVDATGKVVRAVKVASEPEAVVRYFDELKLPVCRIWLQAGPRSQWLRAGLCAAGRAIALLEARHVKTALSAMTVKPDRKDARGIAQLLSMGWYRPVHAKSVASQDTRTVLVGRKLRQGKLLDVEFSIPGIFRGYGRKVGEVRWTMGMFMMPKIIWTHGCSCCRLATGGQRHHSAYPKRREDPQN